MTRLTIVGKPDCHLCHVMADVVRGAVGDRMTVDEADVRTRPEWQAYRFEIPVLLLDGEEIARHRVTAEALRELLATRGICV